LSEIRRFLKMQRTKFQIEYQNPRVSLRTHDASREFERIDAAGPLLLLRVARIESAHKHVERRSNAAPDKGKRAV